MASKNSKAKDKIPSLLDSEAQGGDTSEKGGTFQTGVVLVKAMEWLEREGFTSMVRESLGDTEARFFVPGRGYKKEFIEAKDHVLKPSEFWPEINRFRDVDNKSNGEFQWFTLACTGLSDVLHPLVNGLRRIRGPYGFYEAGSSITGQTYEEYVQRIEKMKHTRAEADFLFGKALIEHQLGPIASQGEAHFHAALVSHHPPYGELSANALRDIYKDLDHLVRERRNQLITRKELEQAMRKRLPANSGLEVPAVRMYTGSSADDAGVDRTELFFDWAEFFGGQERSFPGPQRWNEVLLGQLEATKKWVVDNRSTRRIYLVGNRRLSASLAIGAVFSAVAGFSLEMVGRGERIWATDAYPRNDTPDYPLAITDTSSTVSGERLVVCISVGVKQDTCGEVVEYLQRVGLSAFPMLAVRGTGGIESAEQVNRVVDEIKSAISAALKRSGASEIDLFFAGPAQLALFLGHRLNATAPVQCYEWVATNSYVPTCKLR